jgi:hypothetical protein
VSFDAAERVHLQDFHGSVQLYGEHHFTQLENAAAGRTIRQRPPYQLPSGRLLRCRPGYRAYLPAVGLAQRTRQTIAGPVTYDLSYAHIGGVTVISAPEVTFSLTLDSSVYESSRVMARLTLRVVQHAPLRLSFRTAQEFELVVKNESGDIVYRWSAGRIFLQTLHALNIGPGEKNYSLQLQLADAPRNPLPAGVYTAEAWLTTDGPQLYRAQVAFENRLGK